MVSIRPELPPATNLYSTQKLSHTRALRFEGMSSFSSIRIAKHILYQAFLFCGIKKEIDLTSNT